MNFIPWLTLGLFVSMTSLIAQPKGFNYDEAKVPQFTLPDPLVMANGARVKTVKDWETQRRPELMELFEKVMYGRAPGRPAKLSFFVVSHHKNVLGGKADRKQVEVRFAGTRDGPRMTMLIYLPAKARGPVPTFLTLNFRGNHTIHPDPAIRLPHSWVRGRVKGETENNRATEKGRGLAKGRWPVETLLARGYALATIYYGDIDPDFDDGWQNGVHALYPKPKPDEWGSIATWAWGLSRAMDYLETDKEIDANRVAVMGHSRLGKTSLWAGATDPRFAITISNNSGCGGAALSRRVFGETVQRINTNFPHWFCDNFVKYNANENACPIDQHQLIALMAPRPVYIASAVDDRWADPKGEFLSGLHANPVYQLYGLGGLPAKKQPALDTPSMGTIGYHVRTGRHDVTAFDWAQYLKFADKHLKRQKIDYSQAKNPIGNALIALLSVTKTSKLRQYTTEKPNAHAKKPIFIRRPGGDDASCGRLGPVGKNRARIHSGSPRHSGKSPDHARRCHGRDCHAADGRLLRQRGDHQR